MPNNLKDLIKGARTAKECWQRLDERYSDRPGSIRQVLKNLQDVDISRGKSYERVEKLSVAIKNAYYLLEELKASSKLSEDLGLVGHLLRKLPPELRREWNRYV